MEMGFSKNSDKNHKSTSFLRPGSITVIIKSGLVTNNIVEFGEKKQKGFFGQNDRDHDAAVLLRRSPGNNWSCLTQLRSTRWREGRHSRVTHSAICTAETATHTSYKSKKK